MSKITNYIPKDSIVGRVLNHREQTKVMDAEGSGLVQHDTLMWSVDVKTLIIVMPSQKRVMIYWNM